MNRLAKYAIASLAIAPSMALAQGSQAIYKFVDENGHVTYANSPIKGGAKLNLEPLTVLQSSPAPSNYSAAATRTIQVAKVTSVPSPSSSTAQLPAKLTTPVSAPVSVPEAAAVPPITIAAIDTADKIQEQAQQRRAEVRRRILLGEIKVEENLLVTAKSALTEEQRRSGELRTMRASFAATAAAATTTKPLISPEVRAEIERHFERVRNLQDEVAAHEGNIAALREELVTGKH